MKSMIRKCTACNRFTMLEACSRCGSDTVLAIPPKYSPVDRFQKFRLREMKENGENIN